MTMTQLIYHSQPFGFDPGVLNGILSQARRNNARNGLTGALIVRGDLYLQLLEAPREAIKDCFAKIVPDDRHLDVKCVSERLIPERLFPAWTMRDDQMPSWLWSADEVAAGVVERTTPAILVEAFERLAKTSA